MGGKSGAKSAQREADRARADEAARQARIRQGTADIGRIFSGGTGVTGQLARGAVFDPTKKYYLADGTVWTPPAAAAAPAAAGAPIRRTGGNYSGREQFYQGGGGNNEGSARNFTGGASPILRAASGGGTSAFDKLLKEGKLYSGVETSPGAFNEDFFRKRRQSYIDYATPQLESQHGEAGKQLTYALDRSNLLDSSVRAEKGAELSKLFDINKQKIADEALSYETQTRGSVEDARQNLIQMLNATGDATGAAQSAIARAQALSQQPAYNPLTQLFADFTNSLGVQAAQERSQAIGGPAARYNTGLFAPKGSVVVAP